MFTDTVLAPGMGQYPDGQLKIEIGCDDESNLELAKRLLEAANEAGRFGLEILDRSSPSEARMLAHLSCRSWPDGVPAAPFVAGELGIRARADGSDEWLYGIDAARLLDGGMGHREPLILESEMCGLMSQVVVGVVVHDVTDGSWSWQIEPLGIYAYALGDGPGDPRHLIRSGNAHRVKGWVRAIDERACIEAMAGMCRHRYGRGEIRRMESPGPYAVALVWESTE